MKRRVIYLDLLRCFAALCVIMLHSIAPFVNQTRLYGTKGWLLFIFINSIDRLGVPLFFMLSGCLLLSDPRTRDIRSFYQKRLPRLLVPLILWNIIYYVYLHIDSGSPLSAAEFLRQLLSDGTTYHLWYIYALFGIYLLAPFLYRIVTQCTLRQTALLFLIIVIPTSVYPLLTAVFDIQIRLFRPVENGFLGFFLLGYLLGTAELRRRQRYVLYAAGLFGYGFAVFFHLHSASAESIPLPYNGAWVFTHYLCAGAVFVLFRQVFRPGCLPARAEALVSGLSLLTSGVYWIHVLFIHVIYYRLGERVTPVGAVCILFFGTTALSFVSAWLISRVRPLKRLLM